MRISRRYFLPAIAGILSLSAKNKVFADESGDVEISDHRRMPRDRVYPFIKVSVTYRMPRGQIWAAVAAEVTIQRVGSPHIVSSKATDIGGKATFYCRDRSTAWLISVSFRGQIQKKVFQQNPNFPYINSIWVF